jgi:hypothetical protein
MKDMFVFMILPGARPVSRKGVMTCRLASDRGGPAAPQKICLVLIGRT